ncbi:MAG TPA: surface-adhesin E family protein [Rhodocyclaceae bacterium]|nr:surface-adhesin E family protein [Rhodocyclaceae bacterium]
MRFPAAFFAAFVATTFANPVRAADWQPVTVVGGERVEIDKGRIMRTAPGETVAWTRLVLGRELADAGGSYTAVQAMNRYDCAGHRFATLKRVYMSDDKALREETVRSPKEISAASGSVDEKLLTEACRLRTAGEAHKVTAEAAKQAAAAPEGKPGVMYADMRTAGETPRAHTMAVADAGKPEPKAEAKTEAKVEGKPAGERPRFIDLPKIDKSKVESPQASAKAAEARVTDARALAKSVEKAMETPAVSRQERERLYATSGPHRASAPRRRMAEEPGHAVMEHQDIHWSYEGEGAPGNWAKLRPDYGTCATGRRQSPIDIREGIRVDLEPIRFDYRLTQFRIVDNGHTIEVAVGDGSTITVMGRTYRLTQFHFHRPSEERINGKSFDMVIHFVHRDDEGRLAVVAVLLERGAENPLIQTLWNNMPLEVNQDVTPAVAIDLNSLLPENRAYYTYMGSLTTPPCTEDVLWMVFKQPMPVSAEQVNIFSRLYRNNARPIQASNSRLVKENR